MNLLKNISIIFLLSSFLFSFIISCDSTDPKPPEKPPGYQEDIPWPSLADSPWPMYRGTPQSTGRTDVMLNINGNVKWIIDSLNISSGVAVLSDSTIIVSVGDVYSPSRSPSGIVAITTEGEIKWKYSFENYSIGISSPIISRDGTIYVSATSEKKFYAINSDGTKKWDLYLDSHIIQSGINIGKDGTIYALVWESQNFSLVAISKNGDLLWKMENDRFTGEELSGMSFSPDGNTLYIPGKNNGSAILAVDITNQRILWEFGNDRTTVGAIPIVDREGNIYCLSNDTENNGLLYSLYPTGEIRWQYIFNDVEESWSLVDGYNLFSISKNGEILVGLHNFYCIDYKGKLKWKIQLNRGIASPIVQTDRGECYFVIDTDDNPELLVVNLEGKILHSVPFNTNSIGWYSPAITEAGIFIPSYHSYKLLLID